MSNSLLKAILAMDAYNRGYNEGIKLQDGADVPDSSLGSVTIIRQSDYEVGDPEYIASFYAIAYEVGNEIVISYRGTDNLAVDQAAYPPNLAGNIPEQVVMAMEFYRAVRDDNPGKTITVTGHSLGGGLAGIVGAVYGVPGVLFDNMPFEATAQDIYTKAMVGYLCMQQSIPPKVNIFGRFFVPS